MIEFDLLKNDPEYFNRLISDINSTNQVIILENVLKQTSRAIYEGIIDPEDARMLVDITRNRIKDIQGVKRNSNGNSSGRSISFTPTKYHGHTSVSNNRGVASIIFIIVNIAVTTVMYTLLLISHLIK